jgi:hypothetical protein
MLEAAKRQEMSLKRAIERGEFNAAEEDEDGKDAFRTPERAAGAVPKQRKRLRDQMVMFCVNPRKLMLSVPDIPWSSHAQM